jgi:pyridoxamine 5'-phosphate oxidase
MTQFRSLADIRREYGELCMNEANVLVDPIEQFKLWFEDVLQHEKNDPTAMVLSTADEQGHPDSRVVLLKGITKGHFVFFTNYQSAKGKQISYTPFVALNFYWPQMARQIRIRGTIAKVSDLESDHYFATRPITSQCSALISPQSNVVPSRASLEQALNDLIEKHDQYPLTRPTYWGGYSVAPTELEFWQGRDNRLHDRIHYYQQNKIWHHRRLAP